jgi:hypothetical protein
LLASQAAGAEAALPEAAQTVERMLVRGMLDPMTDAVSLDSFLRFPNAPEAVEREAGDYSIVLANGQGALLAQYPFTPRTQAVETNSGAAGCAARPTAPAAIVGKENLKHMTRTVSAHAPAVQVIAPNGGEVLSGAMIPVTWSAADADGDPLTFSVLYSADGGSTWTAAATGLGGTNFSVDGGPTRRSRWLAGPRRQPSCRRPTTRACRRAGW